MNQKQDITIQDIKEKSIAAYLGNLYTAEINSNKTEFSAELKSIYPITPAFQHYIDLIQLTISACKPYMFLDLCKDLGPSPSKTVLMRRALDMSIKRGLVAFCEAVYKLDGTFHINQVDQYGNNILHRAVIEGRLDIVNFYSDKIDLEVTNNEGVTALGMAAFFNRLAILNVLLSKNANINHQCSTRKYTPLICALYNGSQDTTLELMNKGADLYLKDKNGNTAWDMFFNRFLSKNNQNLSPILIAFKNKNWNFESTNYLNETILIQAAEAFDTNLVIELLKLGVNSQAKSFENKTIFDIATQFNWQDVLQVLKALSEAELRFFKPQPGTIYQIQINENEDTNTMILSN